MFPMIILDKIRSLCKIIYHIILVSGIRDIIIIIRISCHDSFYDSRRYPIHILLYPQIFIKYQTFYSVH